MSTNDRGGLRNTSSALIAPRSFDDMIDIEIICLDSIQDRPSEQRIAKIPVKSQPAGKTVRHYADMVVEAHAVSDFVYSLAPIGARELMGQTRH